jgi:hypothetical protein
MDAQNGVINPRKRRRRRRLDRPPISARLLLDDSIKGEVGVLSEDLFNDLFPASRSKAAGKLKGDAIADYIADQSRSGWRNNTWHPARCNHTVAPELRRRFPKPSMDHLACTASQIH